MSLVEEMQGKPRPTPGILKTIESVMSIVRQSREDIGLPVQRGGERVGQSELRSLFESDLSAPGPRGPRVETRKLSMEEQEAEDLARIRAALYSV